jgi:hypothetical protein
MTRHGHRVTRPAGPEALGGAEQPHPGGHRRRSRNRSCPSHQDQIEVLPIPPRPLSPAAAAGGGVVVSVVLSPAFTRHDDCGAGRPNNICLPRTQLCGVAGNSTLSGIGLLDF